VSNDEHADSLAAQAASWVPPWERQPRPPDRAYQGAAEEAARAAAEDRAGGGDEIDSITGADDVEDPAEQSASDAAGARGDLSAAAAADSRDDLDGGGAETAAVVGAGHEVPGVDSPAEMGSELEPEPSAGELGPELPVPSAVEEAVVDDDPDGVPADLPLPTDGDDAGDVFDAAGDDDVSDDEDFDLVATEIVPDDDAESDEDAGGESDEGAGGESDEGAGGESDEGADGGLGGVAQPPTLPEAESVGDRGRAKAGSAVPGQGRRRRDGGGAVGDGWARTSDEGKPTAEGEISGLVAGAERGMSASADDAAMFGSAEGGFSVSAEAAAERRMAASADAAALAISASSGDGDISELPALMEDAELAAALEAIMLVVDEPVAEMQLAQILEQPTERVGTMLEDLSARYTAAGHGFDLRRAAGGWRLYTRPEYAAYVERFVLDGQSVRLTQAALETLAVVAYKQPVTRSRISAIRGVNCDGVMRTLVTRGLIEECGTEGETGAYLYRTTALFLEKLGLNSVDQLPPLAPFLPDDVEEVLDASSG
jgi:segregation and condensation protein B